MLIRRRIPIVLALITGGFAFLGLTLTASAAPSQVFIYPSGACATTIQACLNAANAGDEVRLQPGTYITSVVINKNVSLVRDDSGGPGAAILQAPPGQRAIQVTGAVDPSAHIAHLTIQGGALAAGNGAGILVQAPAQPSLHDLIIQNNTVSGTNAHGGGLFTESSLTLTNVQFLTNTTVDGSGGGVGTASGVGLTLVNVTVSNNQSFDSGGGVYAGGPFTITGGVIAHNASTAGSGAGLRLVGPGSISGTQIISNAAYNPGGGLRVTLGIALTNTHFISNAAGVGNGAGASGGGLRTNAEAAIFGGSFVANSAEQGGGALVVGDLVLTGTLFRGNTALQNGGGLDVDGAATVTAATFDQNRVLVGNGGGLNAASLLTVTDSLFTANAVLSGTQVNSTGTGGGLFSDGQLTSTGNRFLGNFAERLGGGMDADGLTSYGDQFRGNLTGAQGSGGGLFVAGQFELQAGQFFTNTANTGGGLGVNSSAEGTVANNLFARNVVTFSDGGAAMRLLSATSVVVVHNTLVGTGQANRAAIHFQSVGQFTVTNNIFTNLAQGLKNFGPLTVTEDYNLFFGVSVFRVGPVTVGPNTFVDDPLFANAAGDDFHLTGTSPAIDAGLFQGQSLDFEGDPRGQPAGYDLGFDEFYAKLYLPLIFR